MKYLEFLLKDNDDARVKQVCSEVAQIEEFDSANGRIVLKTDKDTHEIEETLTRSLTGVRLVGQSSEDSVSSAGVAIIAGARARGIVRLIQENSQFKAEGNVSGLDAGEYDVSVNEFGDISDSCNSTGAPVKRTLESGIVTECGILGKLHCDEGGKAKFSLISPHLSLSACVGRSLVISSSAAKVACGIIGRSAGVTENAKKVCACDGKVIWEDQVFGPYAVAPTS